MKSELLLGAAAVGLLITGAVAQQTTRHDGSANQPSRMERIKDPATQQRSTRNSKAPTPGEVQPLADNPQSQNNGQAQGNNQARNENQTHQNNPRVVYPNASQKADANKTTANQPNGQSQTGQSAAQAPATPQRSAQQPSSNATSQPAGQGSQSTQPVQNAEQKTQPANQQNAQTPAQPSPQQQNAQRPGEQQNTRSQASATGRQGSSGVVALNTRQQTSIGRAIARSHVKPLTNINFSIAVGTAVPKSVRLHALSSDLVTFVPQYRGYSYFVVEDQIMIVDPATYEIAAIVPYTGASSRTAESSRTIKSRTTHTAQKPMVSRSVNLSTEQKSVIRGQASRHGSRSVTKREYREGERVPSTVTVEEFPPTVYTEVPSVRSYRYFRDEDDDVVLVDPRAGRVIETIR